LQLLEELLEGRRELGQCGRCLESVRVRMRARMRVRVKG
jgi:hypothetical protein